MRLYHVRHSCGHDCFWEAHDNDAISLLPCPWCTAFKKGVSNLKPVLTLNAKDGSRVLCIKELERDGSIPWPQEFEQLASEPIFFFHRKDAACCKGRMN